MENPLARRPLVQCTLAFIVGILLCTYIKAVRSNVLLFIALGCFVVLWFFLRHRSQQRIFLLLIFCTLGSILTLFQSNSLHVEQLPATGQLQGRVSTLPRTNDTSTIVDLKEVTINGQSISKKVRLYIEQDASLQYNDYVTVSNAKLSIPKQKRNPGGFNARMNAWGSNIAILATSKPENVQTIAGKANLFTLIYAWRFQMEHALQQMMTPDSFGAIKGMLFGDTSDMSETWTDAFQLTGITHVLAVSGQHVSIIAGALALLFDLVGRRLTNPSAQYHHRLLKTIVISSTLLIYCVMAGLSASILRAALMGSLLLWGDWFGEHTDTLTSLAFSALLLLLINPFQLFQAGFILSYAAVLGICAFYPPLRKKIQKRKNRPVFISTILDLLALSFAAQLGVLPVQLVIFGTLPTLSMIVNLLITPFISISAITGFLAAILGSIWLWLGFPFAWITEGCMRLIEWVVLPASRFPYSTIVVGSPPLWGWIALLAFLLLFSKWTYRQRYRWGALSILISSIGIGYPMQQYQQKHSMDVVFLDVGQGDAIYLRQGNTHVLLDGGNCYENYDNGERVLLPFLYHQGVSSLDAIIVSHPDMDHAGGLASVARALPVQLIITSPDTSKPDNEIENIMDVIVEKNIPHRIMMAGDSFSIEQASVHVLAPSAFDQIGNDASLVLRVCYEDTSFLLTGDAEFKTENEIMDQLQHTTILKAGHHGSKNATSDLLLYTLQPQYVIFSAGENNRYNHPHPDTLTRIQNANTLALRTDQLGAISFHVTAKGYTIKTQHPVAEGR